MDVQKDDWPWNFAISTPIEVYFGTSTRGYVLRWKPSFGTWEKFLRSIPGLCPILDIEIALIDQLSMINLKWTLDVEKVGKVQKSFITNRQCTKSEIGSSNGGLRHNSKGDLYRMCIDKVLRLVDFSTSKLGCTLIIDNWSLFTVLWSVYVQNLLSSN